MRDIRPLHQPQSLPPKPVEPIRSTPTPSSRELIYPLATQPRRSARRSFEGDRSHAAFPSIMKWASFLFVLFLGGWGVWQWQEAVQGAGESGYAALEAGARALRDQDFERARQSLIEAEQHFTTGKRWLLGSHILLPFLEHVPGLGRVTSGIALLSAGEELTRGALIFAEMLDTTLAELASAKGTLSLLDLLHNNTQELDTGNAAIQKALRWLGYVHPESLPQVKQSAYQKHETLLRFLAHTLDLSVEHQDLLRELLGDNGPRIYLFLFQNHHELRPTGGFIGSYALLDISRGQIRRFFVDGIFNPDGQLKENIVPPKPIQKISAGWSLHDSNWFPDFPTSAEKARFFYEKTGGPTTDGVIALTPRVLERLLTILGPVDLPEYGVTIDANNFLPLIQTEVELEYDKEENNPKKILGDLTGVILKRLVDAPDVNTFLQLTEVLTELLNERHILLFARERGVQELIEASGWSGKLLTTPYDYLSVIHANINGYKTDGVIKDNIEHRSAIQSDGSILNTVTVTRTHTGGNTPYEWWNKVNANYMRVYVPLGSELLSAEGMTREFPEAPLDYEALGFRRDGEVVREEEAIRIHEESGTRIGEEFGKTVFGNWVYVSPGETVQVTYRYRLPFRLAVQASGEPLPFSVLYQKQAGTSGVKLISSIEYPESLQPIWQSTENLVPYGRVFKQTLDFERNVFSGFVFQSTE